MLIMIDIFQGETVTDALRRELAVQESLDTLPWTPPALAHSEAPASSAHSAEQASHAAPGPPSQEELLLLVKRVVDKKDSGLSYVKSLLTELGVTKASLLLPSQRTEFVVRLRKALGE